jgi:hypothetical protein
MEGQLWGESKQNTGILVFRGSFWATKFLTRMLSVILRIFFSFGKKQFFGEAFDTIC